MGENNLLKGFNGACQTWLLGDNHEHAGAVVKIENFSQLPAHFLVIITFNELKTIFFSDDFSRSLEIEAVTTGDTRDQI